MCGLVAVWSDKKVICPEKWQASIASLGHRGPDAQAMWRSSDQKVTLGHTRLSIIDLATGDQPLISDEGRIVAVVNGEFYDFETIRKTLQKKGYRFKTQSDSEIIIGLYQEYGLECLQHLRGEFAFVLWDEQRKHLLLARDRFGIKPLYYSYHQETLYVASEIKSLKALGVPMQWDSQAALSLESMMYGQEKTCFANITALKPGHYKIFQNGHAKEYKYWDFNFPTLNDPQSDASESELIKTCREKLERAVALRMRADVPVGCYLSGGVDSSAILGLMSQFSKNPVDAFTIAFTDKLYDETKLATFTAQSLNANHHVVTVDQPQLAQYFQETIWHCETLLVNNHAVAKFILSRFVHNAGFKVVLTGEGSDETMAGYPAFREDMLLSAAHDESINSAQLLNQLRQANKLSAGLLTSTQSGNNKFTQVDKMLGFVPSMMRATAERAEILMGLRSGDFNTMCTAEDAFVNALQTLPAQQLVNREPLNQSLYIYNKTMLPGFVLTLLGDRMEMAHSVEGRLPFLDHDLVDFLVNIPTKMKINGLTEKYILREATRDVLIDDVYNRHKHPFMAPPAFSCNQPMHDLMCEKFYGASLKELPFYDENKVITLFELTEKMTDDERRKYDSIFMHLLSACVLQEKFGLSM